MAELFPARDISEAWLLCMESLVSTGGTDANLMVEIATGEEVLSVRQELDGFYARQNSDRFAPVARVADTIFPADLYVGAPGEASREHLYDMQRKAARVEKRFRGDSYFDRLIDWPYRSEDGQTKTWNQLKYRIDTLQKTWERGVGTINMAELAVSTGLPEDGDLVDALACDLRTQHPMNDRRIMGFPCLSHISVTISKGYLHLTATYRNQHFVAKAYGNFVGLVRLHSFFCREVGCPGGTVLCIATHADAELGKNRVPRSEILSLVADCRMIYDEAQS